jgi:PAS domain S-box-containing protein
MRLNVGSISRQFYLLMLAANFFCILVPVAVFSYSTFHHFGEHMSEIHVNYVNAQKQLLRREVEHAIEDIVFWQKALESAGIRIEKEQLQGHILKKLGEITYGENGEGYIFAGTLDGVQLVNRQAPSVIGKNLLQMEDVHGLKVVEESIKIMRENPSGGYLNYWWSTTGETHNARPKVAFMKILPGWDIYVGAGSYLDDVDSVIAERRYDLIGQLSRDAVVIVLVLLGFSLLAFLAVKRIARNIQGGFASFADFFNQAATDAIQIDPVNLKYDEFGALAKSANRMVEERQHADAEVNNALERFQSVLDSIDALIYVADMESYEILFLNQYGKEIFGDVGGKICWQCLQSEQTEPCEFCTNDRLLDAEGKPTGTYMWEFQNTVSGHWFECRAQAIRWSDGRWVRMEIATDVTERKKAESERLSLERQVQHAQKMESLGVLAGGIAHDFNNLLMGVLGYADMAQEDLAPESPARESIREIEIAARRAAELAKQMLAYSGKGKFIVEALNLSALVEEMAHLLQVSTEKTAVLKYDFAEELPAIEADATQIRQVVMNLITNASDAIGEKTGLITVSTGVMHCHKSYLDSAYLEDHLEEGEYVFIEVADNGCGMDAEQQERIFDPFYTTKFTGRGLGLAATLGIVRGHHGTLKVYSEADEGSTFKVLFPVSTHTAPPKKTRRTKEQNWRAEGTILLVDDDKTICDLSSKRLERMGFSVLIACDGEEGVKVFEEQHQEISAVLLDMTMPKMNGEEAFRHMRRINDSVPVILSSGYNEQDATNRFAGKGLAGFIQKPYKNSELVKKLRETLEA